MPFQSESYANRSLSLTPSAAAPALKASRSALSFALLVPFTAGALPSSTNQVVALSFPDPPTDPGDAAPLPPASAGETARPAGHSSASTSRKFLFRILSQSLRSVSEPTSETPL